MAKETTKTMGEQRPQAHRHIGKRIGSAMLSLYPRRTHQTPYSTDTDKRVSNRVCPMDPVLHVFENTFLSCLDFQRDLPAALSSSFNPIPAFLFKSIGRLSGLIKESSTKQLPACTKGQWSPPRAPPISRRP